MYVLREQSSLMNPRRGDINNTKYNNFMYVVRKGLKPLGFAFYKGGIIRAYAKLNP